MIRVVIAWLLVMSTTAMAGDYIGNLSGNRFDPDSINNRFSKWNNCFYADSPCNRFGPYGNPYSPYSMNNRFSTEGPRVYGGPFEDGEE